MVHIGGRQNAYYAVSVHEEDEMVLLKPGEVGLNASHRIPTFYGRQQPDIIALATVFLDFSTTPTLTRQWLLD
jgi:hypothetical protein